jgi:hypothetical protein
VSNLPSDKSNSTDTKEADSILADFQARRVRRPLLNRLKAWERVRVSIDLVTADDVKVAWERVRLAREGGDPELFDFRMVDFKHKLERWLNS